MSHDPLTVTASPNYVDVSGSRALNTYYQNNTNRWLSVVVVIQLTTGTAPTFHKWEGRLSSDGVNPLFADFLVVIPPFATGLNKTLTVRMDVPPGMYYWAMASNDGGGVATFNWWEA